MAVCPETVRAAYTILCWVTDTSAGAFVSGSDADDVYSS